ncbi:MAG: guanylate kinase [Candidatus Nomurabacteria bacterium]|nr:MAG: guanylate kinase [Candidatus Nomurabacteria bacterium]
MLDNINGHVLIVMAPTGSGKGTLIKEALKTFPDLYVTISCTTRAMRPGEVNGKDYYFISSTDFDQKIADGEFLEWATFGNNRYGTLKSEIIPRLQDGQVVIAEIDVQGVEQLHSLIAKDHITTVFIEAGGWENLKARALARAQMSEEELQARYERYLVEVASKDIADVIIDNSTNDFTPAKVAFCELVESLRNRVYND